MTMTTTSIHELKKIIAFKDLPDEILQWILDRSDYHEFEDGSLIRKFGEAINEMYLLLEGSVNFYLDVNGRQVYYFNFDNDAASGGVSGLLPYSRMKTSPGYSYASGRVRMLTIDKKYYQELERLSPELIQKLIGYMTERARAFATMQLQHASFSFTETKSILNLPKTPYEASSAAIFVAGRARSAAYSSRAGKTAPINVCCSSPIII